MANTTINLTHNERQFITAVLSEHPYQVKGRALIPYGMLLASVLFKLEDQKEIHAETHDHPDS